MTLTEAIWLRSTIVTIIMDINATLLMIAFTGEPLPTITTTSCFHAGALLATAAITPLCETHDEQPQSTKLPT